MKLGREGGGEGTGGVGDRKNIIKIYHMIKINLPESDLSRKLRFKG